VRCYQGRVTGSRLDLRVPPVWSGVRRVSGAAGAALILRTARFGNGASQPGTDVLISTARIRVVDRDLRQPCRFKIRSITSAPVAMTGRNS
jgi:hypothetical protein